MIDFPNSPTTGQIYNSGTGPIYIWDGVAWSLVSQATRTARQNNLVVNPAMAVSQENGNSPGNSNYYPADQWMFNFANISGQIAHDHNPMCRQTTRQTRWHILSRWQNLHSQPVIIHSLCRRSKANELVICSGARQMRFRRCFASPLRLNWLALTPYRSTAATTVIHGLARLPAMAR